MASADGVSDLSKLRSERRERALHRLAGRAPDERSCHERHDRRDAAAQADRLALGDDAAWHLLVAPVGIPSPQKAAIVPRPQFAFLRSARGLELGDFRGRAGARRARGAEPAKRHGVFGVVDDRHELRSLKTQEDLQTIGLPLEDFRLQHVLRMTDRHAALESAHQLVEPRAGDQHGAAPVMQERRRHLD